MQKSKFTLSRSQEKLLRQKLQKTLLSIVGIAVGFSLIMVFFAPKLGVFFGLFSIHRNEKVKASAIKPSTPVLSNVPLAAKDDKIIINGYAQAGLTAVLYLNGPEAAKTTVGSDGLFTFTNVSLISGSNTIVVKALDQQGNSSDNSTSYSIVVDKEKPKIKLDSPQNGDTVRNLDKRIEIKGSLNEKATIKINERLAILHPDLTFDFWLGADEGDVNISIQVTDLAGNISEQKLTVKYVKGS